MTTVHVLTGREVPLGGIRAISVRRTLPHRQRALVGAWCFVDHYGPTVIPAGDGGGMDVAPHPHLGLQTVSWLFSGELEHRDSAGVRALVRPGEVNLMTAGRGIAHSEVATPGASPLHGVQLWVALPDDVRNTVRGFEHFIPPVTRLPRGAGTVRVFIGSLPGLASSPVPTFTALVGAQLDLASDAELTLAVNPSFEHALLVDRGSVRLDAAALSPSDLGCVDAGPRSLSLRAGPDGARVILLGGIPFEEEILMWWNFVGRSHEEIVEARREWESGDERFGSVRGYVGEVDRIPAPPLPSVRLLPRRRSG